MKIPLGLRVQLKNDWGGRNDRHEHIPAGTWGTVVEENCLGLAGLDLSVAWDGYSAWCMTLYEVESPFLELTKDL